MHPNPHFHTNDKAELTALVKAYPFALIIGQAEGRIHVAHTPVLIDTKQNVIRLRFHLARHNPACQTISFNGQALIIVTGANDYISPDWYGVADQVPTWNYLSAEAEGQARGLSDLETAQFLDDLSDTFENTLAPKPVWKRSKMVEGKFANMQNAITGFALTPDRFECIRKLSQNKPFEAQTNAARALAAHSPSSDIAAQMADPK